jgi:hypothetical protein
MNEIINKRLAEFEKKFPYRTRDTQEFSEKIKIKEFLESSIKEAYEAGFNEAILQVLEESITKL